MKDYNLHPKKNLSEHSVLKQIKSEEVSHKIYQSLKKKEINIVFLKQFMYITLIKLNKDNEKIIM